jgi:hypothetical protein
MVRSKNRRRVPDGKVTLQDLKPLGLLDLYRRGSTWVASIRLKNGRPTNLPLEPTIVQDETGKSRFDLVIVLWCVKEFGTVI